ncbi:MAG: glycoside hydrolase family 5 protein [Bacteroidaceae bacterium]|nr:glycoside hydrolase family 5 protein [Bacteroidaceae bacterium]
MTPYSLRNLLIAINLFLLTFAGSVGLRAADSTAAGESGMSQEVSVKEFPSAKSLAKLMFPGWNLANTMEATGGETSWQDTRTSQEIIDYVRSKGFRSVRIPCAWYIYLDNGKIDPDWMARVREVVDYCVKADLYVILNDHWDSGWLEVEGFTMSHSEFLPVDKQTIQQKIATLKLLWTAIATEFRDYDEHLIFAGMNEPFQEYSLFNDKHETLNPILQQYNQAFVDAVRATGGNNRNRTLVVQGPGASVHSTSRFFTIPQDIDGQKGKLMVEAHFYDPWGFTGGMEFYYWGKNNCNDLDKEHNSQYAVDEDYVKQQFSLLHDKFVANDVPVIVGEYGSNWRDLSNTSGASQAKHDNSVKDYYKAINMTAKNYGIVPFVWDINVMQQNGVSGICTILNRGDKTVFCQPAYDGIMEGCRLGEWPY